MNRETLHAFATDLRATDAALYALLNPLVDIALDEPLHLNALRRSLGDEAILRVLRPDLAHTPSICPLLVTLAAPKEPSPAPLLNQLADQAQLESQQDRRYVCGLLSSHADAETVAARLVTLGQLPGTEGVEYFPIHEPLRMEVLIASLGKVEPGPWSPVEHWLYPDSNGTGSILSASSGRNSAFNEFSTQVQKEVPMVAALLSSWRRTQSVPMTYAPARWQGSTLLPPRAAGIAYKQIHQARQRGLEHSDDILLLALMQLNIHPQLHRHPRISQLISAARDSQTPLTDVFGGYTDRDWQRVIGDLDHAGA